jgi:hypothetical protein
MIVDLPLFASAARHRLIRALVSQRLRSWASAQLPSRRARHTLFVDSSKSEGDNDFST